MVTDYYEFLKSKEFKVQDVGFDVPLDVIHPQLFDYQRDITRWAIRKGRVAIFEDVGLGKTIQMGEFMRQINRPALIVSPLTVAHQTVDELKRLIDMDVRYVRSMDEVTPDHLFYITNYDMVDKMDASAFDTVVLDESSILKNLTGKMRNALIAQFKHTPYKLCATATPAPNDIEEIGNHAEFLNVMTHSQMLSTFFVHDSQLRNGAWRLKKRAVEKFYQWMASWSIALEKPSDLGYSDQGFEKPQINHQIITVDTDYQQMGKMPGFEDLQISATDAKRIRRTSIPQRADKLIELVNQTDEQFIVWCGLNNESEMLDRLLPDAVNVTGSMKAEDKVDAIRRFVSGDIRILISKTKIAGMGVNLQNCHNMIWFGIDYSWEQFYQGLGRIVRYGQRSNIVNNYIITSKHEKGIVDTIFKKDKKASRMRHRLIQHMVINSEVKANMDNSQNNDFVYATDETETDQYKMWLGDSVERMREIPSESVDLSVYSPPFDDVFVFSNSHRDIGNSKDYNEFMEHYRYIIRENLRITMPGRLCCVHVSELRTLATRDGFRGLVDFSGRVIEEYVNEGWIWRSRITIDKNPQSLAIRTKDTDLLFATLKRDSASSAPMNTDYLLVFQKPGVNLYPINPVERGEVSQEDWILWARSVWYDISETDVLNVRVAKSDEDEKHMCPLQLPLIDRCVRLWSNPGETVFSPFAGIGSEGYQAIQRGRKYHGIELKPEYYQVAVSNLQTAVQKNKQLSLFDSVVAN